MISNSNSLRHLNNPLNQKVITRNPTYRSTINFGEVSSTNRPFSRKPLNQADHSSSQNIQINDK
jgi:CDP-glycerol glycerophosphotransferase (TagB/SpsB family)